MQISKRPSMRDYDTLDMARFTSSAAELMAAVLSVETLKRSLVDGPGTIAPQRGYVIVSDSEYVVNGVRIWYKE